LDGTGSGSFPVMVFGIRGVDHSGFASGEFVKILKSYFGAT
jgi:hypothetical protein